MFSSLLFISTRIFQIITLIPTLGMLAWFVHGYVSQNALTPDFILILFIASVLGAAWCIATLVAYARARYSALFVALVDLGFLGLFIAAVYELRGIASANCNNFSRDPYYITLGVVGGPGLTINTEWSFHPNKECSMLKACFAFGIMNCIFFFTSFLLALLVHRHHRDHDVVVKRTTHVSRHSHRPRSRDYGYSSSPRRSHHSSRRYYV
ncbi:hypothetical protein BFW01_g1594 [Lasiodiplodia theobromae]|uniref:MARVEL domain-containing protein n=1 Tax=Lasiodiplodia theobromae TaxID=45133 RepID=A0A5N5D0S9_9PEZI|nr:uncharacterized protein LTHEOB_2898 [Lasiodiplodia theobromae]KAB2571062.1 hypothetical protein DBV05_g10283 [Lasiodiplodia theobromae]KAF4534923.1 hypothetical protein LTHEOB_2898 [Lasiodiplodia theobromae]KAF9641611.1 hypothetical protein BFW01_g1594 [Lasiodiplodia theobromae]